MLFFVKNFSSKTAQYPSIYKDLSHFCVIITRASTRRTIPVAFIFSNLLNYLFFLQFLLRCPISSSAFKSLPHLSTAATRSGRFICRQAALPSLPSSFHIYLSPYFTNYAVSICKLTEIIPPKFAFSLGYDIIK